MKATLRITPAYAGKSVYVRIYSGTLQDHPRLCGEKFSFSFLAIWFRGSPPPMRGKGSSPIACKFAVGITPAYAGKSAELGKSSSLSGDHPRLCEEKWWTA